MWGRSKESGAETIGGDFEQAAARVSAAVEPDNAPEASGEGLEGAEDSLLIRPEWAEAAARLVFLPAARLSHPAYALSDEEAERISPQMQAFLQAVADKYAPELLGRLANKYPEFFDLTAAVGVLYWQKWRYVSQIRQMEARARAEEGDGAKPASDSAIPTRPKAVERDANSIRVI